MEAAEDEFQLARIGVDVADGVNPGDTRAVVEGVDLHRILRDVEVPVGNGTEFGAQTEERHPVIGLDGVVTVGLGFDLDRSELPIAIHADDFGVGHQLNTSRICEVHDFLYAIEVPAKLPAAVHQGDLRGNAFSKENCPVQSGVTPTGNHHLLVAVKFGVFNDVLDAFVFEVGQLRHRRLARLEATQSAGDGDDGCAVLRAPVGSDDELVFVIFFDLFGALAQSEAWLERLGLFHQAVHQLTRENRRVSGDIVDRLFGINLRTLTTGLRQGINQVAAQFEQSSFKHGKEATRARSNDEDIRLDHG